MSDCGCHCEVVSADERPALRIALGLNAGMGVVGIVAGLWGDSTGLLADALDMFFDATAYAIALAAIGRTLGFKIRAASLSGALLLALAVGLLAEVGRRAVQGSEPQSLWMIATATLSLIVNVTVMRLLRRFRDGEVHLRATWIFTRADVIANLGVIGSGLLVLLTGNRYFDLIIGSAIGVYVIREAVEILRDAYRKSSKAPTR